MDHEAIEGGCLCGAVRYRTSGDRSDATHCHCPSCRRSSAAPFVSWVTFPVAAFAFIKDKPLEYASSARVVRSFCGSCGTPLTYCHDSRPDLIDVTVCSLDQPDLIAPRDHIWTQYQLGFIKLADNLPRYYRLRKTKAKRLNGGG
jgi:hypothetical protein